MRVELRYRPSADESIETRHKKIMSGFYDLPEPWGVEEGCANDFPDIDGELQVSCGLKMPGGLIKKAKMQYIFRGDNYLKDKGHYDDALFIDLDITAIEYKYFLKEILPLYIKIYQPYRGVISLSEDLTLDDWDEIADLRESTGIDVDGRDTVYRINVVNYFDRQLCQRAFNLSPERIMERLDGKVESISLLNNGVLLIYSSKFLNRDAVEKIDSEIRPLLG